MATGELLSPDTMSAQHLPADLMLVRMEGEHILTMASARRQPLATVIKEACELLEAYPEAAHQAVYSKPVGLKPDRCRSCGHEIQRKGWQKFNPRCGECGGKNANMIEGRMQYARGLSVRAMESLSNLVGYNRLHQDAEQLSEGIWKVSAVFVDYSRGVIRSDSDLVSQYRTGRGGTKYKEEDQKFLEMTIRAAKSKTGRNAVGKALPFELRQAYEQKAMEVAPKTLTPQKIKEIVEAFEGQGVTLGDLNTLLRRDKADKWTKEDAETLRGIWTALENGEMTVDELLAECRRPVDAPVDEDGASDPAPTADGKQGSSNGSASAVAAELLGTASDAKPVASSQPKSAQAGTDETKGKTKSETKPESKPESKAPETGKQPKAPEKTPPATGAKRPTGPTAAALLAFITDRFEEESKEYNVELLAKEAADNRSPYAFVESIINKLGDNWQSYAIAPASSDDPEDLQDDGIDQTVPDQAEAAQEEDGGRPKCITDPVPRPARMELIPLTFEEKIIGKRSPEEIRKFAKGEVKGHPDMTNEECAYLMDLCERRAYQLENNLPRTDRVPGK